MEQSLLHLKGDCPDIQGKSVSVARKVWLICLFRWTCLVTLGIGLLLFFFVKDSRWPVSAVYYALPVKLLLVVSAVYFFSSFLDKFHRWPAGVSFAFLACYVALSPSGFILGNSPPTIAFWNVSKGELALDDFFDYVNKTQAEIYTFVEFKNKLVDLIKSEELSDKIPGYKGYLMPGEMAVIYKEGMVFKYLDFKKGKTYRFNMMSINGVVICLVDIQPWPFYDRGKAVSALAEFSGKSDVICGDFNTPYDSVQLDLIRKNYNSGITENFGGRETWPSYFPVLPLDHIFVSNKHGIVMYRDIKSRITDHYPVMAAIRWNQGERL